jgi:spermidine/putrescine-binding protein
MKIQEEYDKIYRFFKTTTEPFDKIDWDGKELKILLNNEIIETYSRKYIKAWKNLN